MLGCGGSPDFTENWQGGYVSGPELRTNGHPKNTDRFMFVVKWEHWILICDDAKSSEYRTICSNGGYDYGSDQ